MTAPNNKLTGCTFQHLGQTGLKVNIDTTCLLIDPYLSNSVQELDAPDLIRQVPIPYDSHSLQDVDWVLITHEHLDHCDPYTIPILAKASPHARFVGPEPVRKQLRDWGISEDRIVQASSTWLELESDLRVCAVPAAHPRVLAGADGQPKAVGYLLERHQKRVWVAGDTSVCEDMIEYMQRFKPIQIALLPVNEDNFFRRRRGIVGNMSVREAFGLATELGIEQVVPVHWDLFEANSTTPEEIRSVYHAQLWPFELVMAAEELTL